MTSSEVAKYLFEQLVLAGCTKEGACAVLGNVQAESGFVSNNLENSYNNAFHMTDVEYTAAVNNGTYTNFIHDQAGYGLAQWTFWSRKENLLNYMNFIGKPIDNVEGQVAFLIKELKENFASIWKTMITSSDLYSITWNLLDRWENPAVKDISTRYQYALNWYRELSNIIVTPNTQTVTVTTTKLTEAQAINKVLDLARSELGYKEKRSNAQLDDKEANAGSGNWTKYARDLDAVSSFYNGPKNGYAWCDIFVDWLFYHLFGAQAAMNMLCQPARSCGAGCSFSAGYYMAKGRWTKTPAPGHQIFFISGDDVYHTGIVEKVNGSQIVTIEGNTSDCVARRTYSLNDGRIYGYGIPQWSYATSITVTPESTPTSSGNTSTSTSTVSTILRLGSTGVEVKTLQENLIKLGYSCGKWGADGDFGNDTLAAVKKFQKDNGLVPDGEVGPLTSAALRKQLNTKKTSQVTPKQTDTKTYTVKQGDTLWNIAVEQLGAGYRYSEIKKLNGLTSDVIKPGQKLKLP